jgi:hypothetical protein
LLSLARPTCDIAMFASSSPSRWLSKLFKLLPAATGSSRSSSASDDESGGRLYPYALFAAALLSSAGLEGGH